jgi:hypothetical protein
MNSTKFYQPYPAKLTGRELAFSRRSLDKSYRHNTGFDVPDFDFAVPASPHRIMTRRTVLQYTGRPEDFEPEFFDMGPFQITYNFSHATRKHNFPLKNALPTQPRMTKEYGASGWSFRLLYEFLCEAYNRGTPFVDTYFEKVFRTRPVYADFKAIYETIQGDINDEALRLFMALPLKADGTPDMRYNVSKKFKDFKVWQDPIVRQDCKNLATSIRHDIEVCLRNGRLPLRGKEGATVSGKTRALRAELGGMVHADRLFYASGQLIRHLNIYVKVGDVAA